MDVGPALVAVERGLADVRAACGRIQLSVPAPVLPEFDLRLFHKALVLAAGRTILRALRVRKAVRVLLAKKRLKNEADAVLGLGPFYRGPG